MTTAPLDSDARDASLAQSRQAGLALGALGMAVGATSLAWPLSPDQSLFYYIAREWVRSGAVPYRDTFDHKTPGIYALYALIISVFGERTWPLRLVEWLTMIPLGILTAALATPRGERVSPWRAGFGVAVANVFYFGFYDFFDVGQCEIWCVFSTVVALWLVVRTEAYPLICALGAGVLASAALLFKLPSLPLTVVVFGALVVRAREERRLGTSCASFIAGGALLLAFAIGWFWTKGALPALREVLVDANREFTRREGLSVGVSALIRHLLRTHHRFDPFSLLISGALAAGIVRDGLAKVRGGRRSLYVLALLLSAAGTLGVIWQRKFYVYHWPLVLSGHLLGFALLTKDLSTWGRVRPKHFAFALAALYALNGEQFLAWSSVWARTAEYVVRREDHRELSKDFYYTQFFFYEADVEDVGLWLKARAAPGDRLLVRGQTPGIYAHSGLSYGGRFMWDTVLVDPRRRYHRDEWLAQDSADLERIAPRWVVALRQRPDWPGWYPPAEIQSAPWFEARGYHVVWEAYQFVVMERTASAAQKP